MLGGDHNRHRGGGRADRLIADGVGKAVRAGEAGVGRVDHVGAVGGDLHAAVGPLGHGRDGQLQEIGHGGEIGVGVIPRGHTGRRCVVGHHADRVRPAVLAHRLRVGHNPRPVDQVGVPRHQQISQDHLDVLRLGVADRVTQNGLERQLDVAGRDGDILDVGL